MNGGATYKLCIKITSIFFDPKLSTPSQLLCSSSKKVFEDFAFSVRIVVDRGRYVKIVGSFACSFRMQLLKFLSAPRSRKSMIYWPFIQVEQSFILTVLATHKIQNSIPVSMNALFSYPLAHSHSEC